jgi:hydrogenase assembly chaperone HypC/HupF
MCRTVPRLVLRVAETRAEVDYDGRPLWVDTRGIEQLQPGEYVAVYAGAALERLSPELALELLSIEDELERMLAESVAAHGLDNPLVPPPTTSTDMPASGSSERGRVPEG